MTKRKKKLTKEEQKLEISIPDFKPYCKAAEQNSIVLAWETDYRDPWNRSESRNNLIHL